MRILVLVLLLLVVIGSTEWMRFAHSPLRLTAAQLIEVTPGTGYGALLAQWRRNGWLARERDVYWLKLMARLDDQATSLQAGEYQLRPGTTPLQALAQIRAGEIYLRSFTVVEGWSLVQLRGALALAPGLRQTIVSRSDAQIMQALQRDDQAAEGSFLPETYHYARGSSDLELLRRAANAMDQALAKAWAERDEGLPLSTPQQALVLASIIEKETGLASERRQIAGVFVRRLQRGMRLQTDPTVIYGLGTGFDGNLRRADLRRDTPFNTYTRAGLPPTPIAMPGRASIHAALHPLPGDSLYFVSRGDGSHYFSSTLAEHERAVDKFQR